MNGNDFIQHVDSNTLITHIQTMKSVLSKKICLVLYDLQNYLKYQKNQKINEIRNQISEKEAHTTDRGGFRDMPTISSKRIDYVLCELQMRTNCSHRLVDTSIELAQMVLHFTKSIAQIPHK